MKKEIYLAGGCFWGTEKYLQELSGVLETEVGYVNGTTLNPTYEDVCYRNTGHAEAVKVLYDDELISLPFILKMYYEVINPISINRQGGDIGTQYRTGVYYSDSSDRPFIEASIAVLQTKFTEKVAIEVKPLENYFRAEEYHQKYLDKNPNGYCHIGKAKFEQAKATKDKARIYRPLSRAEAAQKLTKEQFRVTQDNGTEAPFHNEYANHYEKGIYVDITTGEPLFASSDKFESGCGWPSFSKPIYPELIREKEDLSLWQRRIEVRSKHGDIHLGHVFSDGPTELGGLRYCINSAALKFIPLADMEAAGYGEYIPLVH